MAIFFFNFWGVWYHAFVCCDLSGRHWHLLRPDKIFTVNRLSWFALYSSPLDWKKKNISLSPSYKYRITFLLRRAHYYANRLSVWYCQAPVANAFRFGSNAQLAKQTNLIISNQYYYEYLSYYIQRALPINFWAGRIRQYRIPLFFLLWYHMRVYVNHLNEKKKRFFLF